MIEADGIHDACLWLAEHDFDVVVVDPTTEGCGLDFVNAIKEGAAEHQLTIATLYGARGHAKFLEGVKPPTQDQLDAARDRHRLTPFVVLPLPRETEYAVIVVAQHAWLSRDTATHPVVGTVLTIDAQQVLKVAPALC